MRTILAVGPSPGGEATLRCKELSDPVNIKDIVTDSFEWYVDCFLRERVNPRQWWFLPAST